MSVCLLVFRWPRIVVKCEQTNTLFTPTLKMSPGAVGVDSISEPTSKEQEDDITNLCFLADVYFKAGVL